MNINNMITTLIFILSMVIGSSCKVQTVKSGKKKIDKSSPSPTGSTGSTSTALVQNLNFNILSYNQINSTFSKLTGISRGQKDVSAIMSAVKNSLPSGNDLNSYSEFHQISITRLAFTYCNAFVDESTFFKQSASENDSEDKKNVLYFHNSTNTNESIVRFFINRFLDEDYESSKFTVLKKEMTEMMENKPDPTLGAPIYVGTYDFTSNNFPPDSDPPIPNPLKKLKDEIGNELTEEQLSEAIKRERLSKMTCTLVLSSSFVSLI